MTGSEYEKIRMSRQLITSLFNPVKDGIPETETTKEKNLTKVTVPNEGAVVKRQVYR